MIIGRLLCALWFGFWFSTILGVDMTAIYKLAGILAFLVIPMALGLMVGYECFGRPWYKGSSTENGGRDE